MDVGALRLVLGVVLAAVVAGTAFGAMPADSVAGVDRVRIDTAGIDATGEQLTIEGDPGGVDAQRAYDQIQELYDRELPAVTARFNQNGGVTLQETHPNRFFGLLADPSIRIERDVHGAASGDLTVVSYWPGTEPAFVERVFAHELAHAAQPESLREDMEAAAGDYGETTDSMLARQSVAEGAAVFVTDVYADRYLDVQGQSARLDDEWGTMTDATRLLWAPYRYGADYARARAVSPANLTVVYDDPPLTTEEVLHPAERGAEPTNLTVESNGQVADWDHTATDTKGELYLRVLLASELAPERAARGAAGWGADRLLTYAGEGNDSFAWVLTWDSPQDASQFESAMADYLNATATRQGESRTGIWSDGEAAFRLDCSIENTCYVLAGDPGFVNSARVTGNASDVVVSE